MKYHCKQNSVDLQQETKIASAKIIQKSTPCRLSTGFSILEIHR